MLRPAEGEVHAGRSDEIGRRAHQPDAAQEPLELAPARDAGEGEGDRRRPAAGGEQADASRSPPALRRVGLQGEPGGPGDGEETGVLAGRRETGHAEAAERQPDTSRCRAVEGELEGEERKQNLRDVGIEAMALEDVERSQGEARGREESRPGAEKALRDAVQGDDRKAREGDCRDAPHEGERRDVRRGSVAGEPERIPGERAPEPEDCGEHEEDQWWMDEVVRTQPSARDGCQSGTDEVDRIVREGVPGKAPREAKGAQAEAHGDDDEECRARRGSGTRLCRRSGYGAASVRTKTL